MDRRSLIKNLALVVSGVSFLSIKGKSELSAVSLGKNNKATYLLFHGNIKKDDLTIISKVVFTNPSKVDTIIKKIRKKHNFKPRFKYSSTNKFRIVPLKEILDTLISKQLMKVTVVISTNTSKSFEKLSPEKFNVKRVNKVLGSKLSIPNKNIFVKYESPGGPSFFYKNLFKKKVNKELIPQNVFKDERIQIADVVSGSILASLKNEVKNANKIEIIEYLRALYGVNRFEKGKFNNGLLKIKILK